MGANIVNIDHPHLTYGAQGGNHRSITGVLDLVKREAANGYFIYALKLSDCGSASNKAVEVLVSRKSLKDVARALLSACQADENGEGNVL